MDTITDIFKYIGIDSDEDAIPREEYIGYIDANAGIYKLRWGQGRAVGRVDELRRLLRTTTHGEQELGHFTPDGQIYSAGLLEGGLLGWLDPDGTVVRAGLILGEEEVGRVVGPHAAMAAAALLLLFLPDDAEADKRMKRQP